jgi:hypothetical protein
MVKVQHGQNPLAVLSYVCNGGFLLRFLAKLEYLLEILIHRLKDLTKKNVFLKKSKTIHALVQKIQLDEHGKLHYYVMFATMDMLIYQSSFNTEKKGSQILVLS